MESNRLHLMARPSIALYLVAPSLSAALAAAESGEG